MRSIKQSPLPAALLLAALSACDNGTLRFGKGGTVHEQLLAAQALELPAACAQDETCPQGQRCCAGRCARCCDDADCVPSEECGQRVCDGGECRDGLPFRWPLEGALVEPPAAARLLAVEDTLLAAAAARTVFLFDLGAKPPALLASVSLDEEIGKIALFDGTLMALARSPWDGRDRIHVIDASVPRSPRPLPVLAADRIETFSAHGSLLWAVADAVLYLIDIRSPANPSTIAERALPCPVGDLVVSGYRSAIDCGEGGTWVVDATDPWHPAVERAPPGGAAAAAPGTGCAAAMKENGDIAATGCGGTGGPALVPSGACRAFTGFDARGGIGAAACREGGAILFDTERGAFPLAARFVPDGGAAAAKALVVDGALLLLGEDGRMVLHRDPLAAGTPPCVVDGAGGQDAAWIDAAYGGSWGRIVTVDRDLRLRVRELPPEGCEAPGTVGEAPLASAPRALLVEQEGPLAVVVEEKLIEAFDLADPAAPAPAWSVPVGNASGAALMPSFVAAAAGGKLLLAPLSKGGKVPTLSGVAQEGVAGVARAGSLLVALMRDALLLLATDDGGKTLRVAHAIPLDDGWGEGARLGVDEGGGSVFLVKPSGIRFYRLSLPPVSLAAPGPAVAGGATASGCAKPLPFPLAPVWQEEAKLRCWSLDGSGGLSIVSEVDPLSPFLETWLPPPLLGPWDAAAIDVNLLFLAGPRRLVTADIASPSGIILAGSGALLPSRVDEIDVTGGLAVLRGAREGGGTLVQLVDVTKPGEPRFLGGYAVPKGLPAALSPGCLAR